MSDQLNQPEERLGKKRRISNDDVDEQGQPTTSSWKTPLAIAPLNGDSILSLVRAYQPAAVVIAATDLDLFTAIGTDVLTVREIAERVQCPERGITILCDALAGLSFLRKDGGRYAVPEPVRLALGQRGPGSFLAMVQHSGNMYRRWGRMAEIVQTGHGGPVFRQPSVRGAAADEEAFIEAMNNMCEAEALDVLSSTPGLKGNHFLDVGGATGTWTLAYLKLFPGTMATLFDLPHVIPLADARIRSQGAAVKLVAGDFYSDPLPGGVDIAWVSAICHQNSREQNRELFAKVYEALEPGGLIAIRDVLLNEDRTTPVSGALFSVNMLVNTVNGNNYTFAEYKEDLQAAGFIDVQLARKDAYMHNVLLATKS